MIQSEKILVLGAGGFIGGRVFKLFSEKGFEVISTSKNEEFICLDVLKDDWKTLIKDVNPSVIINCIAYGNSHDHSDVELIKKTTLDFPKELIKFCQTNLALNAFIQLGSSSEYGGNCSGATELFELQPNSEYSVNKGLLSEWCHAFTYNYNFPLIYFRLFSVYGPGELESRLIPTLLREAHKGGFPALGDAEVSRDFVHVDDVVSAIEKAILTMEKNKGEIFNICSGKNTTLKKVCKIVGKQFNLEVEPEFSSRPNHKWDLESWYGDGSKAKSHLDWEPKISLKDFFRKAAK